MALAGWLVAVSLSRADVAEASGRYTLPDRAAVFGLGAISAEHNLQDLCIALKRVLRVGRLACDT